MKITVDFSDKSYLYTHFPSTTARMMFFYPLMVGYEECGKRYFLERDDFNDYLILYTVSGKGIMKYRGREYTIQSGNCIYISCNEYHTYHTVSEEPWVITWMHFNGTSAKMYFDKIYSISGPVINLEDRKKVPKTIGKIIQCIKNKNNKAEIQSSLFITEVLTELLIVSNFGISEEETPEEIIHAIAFIENNYTNNLSLDTISSKVGVSKFYLSHKFKQHTGYSIHEYIIRCRIEESKKMLITSNDSIALIADKLGFDTPSNFSRLFKQKVGYLPLKYRKSRNQQTQTSQIKYSDELKNNTVNL